MIPLAHVFKELLVERTRLLLTILAIAWGTASITVMLALGEGLRLTFGRSGRGMGEGILIVWPGQTSRAYGGLPEGQPVPLTEEDLERLRSAFPELAGSSGEYRTWLPMRQGDRFRTGRLMGVHPDYGELRNIIPPPGSRFLNPLDLEHRRRVAILGLKAVEELFGLDVDPVGQRLEIDGRPFLVVGVMQKKYQMSSYSGPDHDGVWIPITTFATMYHRQQYNNLVLKPQIPAEMEGLKTRLRELLASRYGGDPQDEGIVRYWDTLEQQRISGKVFSGLQMLLGIVGGLTLIVAGVGIANVMYVSVSNATRDIGIRMAVGARSYQVLSQYVLEGLLATAIGGLVGIGAGWLVVWAVDQLPMQGEFFEFVGRPVPVLSLRVALIVVAVLGIVGLLAGLFPARRAAQVDPAEALRYE